MIVHWLKKLLTKCGAHQWDFSNFNPWYLFRLRTHSHWFTHAQTHTCTNKHTHKHTHTHTKTYAHAYTPTVISARRWACTLPGWASTLPRCFRWRCSASWWRHLAVPRWTRAAPPRKSAIHPAPATLPCVRYAAILIAPFGNWRWVKSVDPKSFKYK